MNIKYLRLNSFYALLKPFSDKHRAKRMEKFAHFLTECGAGQPKIIDLGGQPGIWQFIRQPLDITIINLPGEIMQVDNSIHTITYLEGDACHVSQFEDNKFDIVFSNSVIEHVGDDHNQASFAKEVHRLAPHHWIQTPSKYFPVEAHCGMPLWWFWPESFRQSIISRWRQKVPKWTEMVAGTRVLSKQRMQELFAGSKIMTERSFGLPKSYIAYQ